jgi:hypothetical protein
MRSIAYRRHHAARIRRNFRKIVKHCWQSSVFHDAGWVEHMVRRFARTRKPCSCRGCGNQRRWEGPTIQERRST